VAPRSTDSAAAVEKRLKELARPAHAAVLQRFFKTGPGEYGAGDRFLGLKVPALRLLAREYESLPRRELTMLLRSPWHEARLLALLIMVRQFAAGGPRERKALYRLYLRNTKHINNWDLVDLSAPQIVGAYLEDRDRTILRRLAESPSLWERRNASLRTLDYIRQGEFRDALGVARILIDDCHDLIHKAVRWMLREIGKRDRKVEEEFLARYAARMPRTALRYAIEHFPESRRRRYLAAKRIAAG
jgi:3-methyladenine DNA glycosylase AlkD